MHTHTHLSFSKSNRITITRMFQGQGTEKLKVLAACVWTFPEHGRCVNALHLRLSNCSLQGTIPKLTAKSNCRYEVEWITEYACHRDYLESETCSLSSEQHDITIDLSPLAQQAGMCGASVLSCASLEEPGWKRLRCA